MTSPRHQISKDPVQAAAHSEWVNSPQFRTYMQLALLQMTRNAGTPPEQGPTTVAAYRLQGAQIFIATLETLSMPETVPDRRNPDALPYHDT